MSLQFNVVRFISQIRKRFHSHRRFLCVDRSHQRLSQFESNLSTNEPTKATNNHCSNWIQYQRERERKGFNYYDLWTIRLQIVSSESKRDWSYCLILTGSRWNVDSDISLFFFSSLQSIISRVMKSKFSVFQFYSR